MKAKIMGRSIDISDELLRSDTQRSDLRTVRRERAVNVGEPIVQFSAPAPLPGWPKPTDKWNYAYAQFLELEKQAGRVAYWIYEPWSMWLPGGIRYKPDFLVVYQDGLEQKPKLVEVKGWSKNLRDGKTRYAIAAALFPCFDWVMVKRKGHGWEEYV